MLPTDEAHVYVVRVPADAAVSSRDFWRQRLEHLVHTYLPSGSAVIDRSCSQCGAQHGKPVVLEHGHPSRLAVSAAHTADVALLAFAAGVPIGVDVELVKPDFRWTSIAGDVFSAAERCEVESDGASRPDTLRAYYQRWVAKEAILKATGAGLAGPVKDVDTTGWPDVVWQGWHARPLPLDAPLVGALASSRPLAAVRLLVDPA